MGVGPVFWEMKMNRPEAGKGSPAASPYGVGVGVVAGGGWIAVVGGRETADGMKMNPPGGQGGRACGAPLV